ncbi:MAG: PEGA domain-containing protein [Planctomycetota bacterium]
MLRRSSEFTTRLLVVTAALVCLLQTGCVRRRLMVRSNPPGAMVYVDNQPIGTTPCATDFTYYGTREIRLVKAGYETLTVNQPLPAPWYQIPPLDFVSENLIPRKIQDYRTASFNMVPQVIVPTEQLIARGEQLRQSTLQGAIVPTTAIPATTTPIPVLPPDSNQPIFVPPALGQPALGQPTLGQPTLAPPGAVVLPPGSMVPQQQSIVTPVTPGTGTLPIGGQPIETLPPPR